MKTILYKVFAGNKWTSTLIIFSVLAFLMIFWTIANDGVWALDLTEPTEFILRMLLPIVFSVLYLTYRFINEGKMTSKVSLESETTPIQIETKKSVFNLTTQLVVLFIIAAVASIILYYYLVFSLISIPHVIDVVFVILSVPTLIFWIYKSISSVKHANLSGTNLSASTKLLLMFLAFLSFYFAMNTYGYINTIKSEKEWALHEAQSREDIAKRIQERNAMSEKPDTQFFEESSMGMTSRRECEKISGDKLDREFLRTNYPNVYICHTNTASKETDYDFYRFLYTEKGTYESPAVNSVSFRISVPEGFYVDDKGPEDYKESLVNCYDKSTLDGTETKNGTAVIFDSAIKICGGLPAKMTVANEKAKTFDEFITGKEYSNVKRFGQYGAIISTHNDSVLGQTNSVTIYMGPGKSWYIYSINSDQKFVWDSLEIFQIK